MSKSGDAVTNQIRFEVGQIDQLLTVYADLLARVQARDPDAVELAAVASVLHSFYNGLEKIFETVAKGIDGVVPSGGQSHRELLAQMTRASDVRPAVISSESADRLVGYLGFRHFFRHSYSFFIDWQELKELVVKLPDVWSQLKGDLQKLMDAVG